MINRFGSLASRLAVTFAFLFGVAACGGGGGSDNGFLPDRDDGTTYKITLSITDSSGNPTSPPNTVTATVPVVLTALVKKSGKPAQGVVVAALADIGNILPQSGTALTDADGEATFQLAAGDALGAGTVEVTVEDPDGGEPSTATISFQVGQAGLRLGHFEPDGFVDGDIGLSASDLAVGGSAVLRLAVVDENDDPATSVETINLRSDCALAGLATLPASVETVNGQATATYTDKGCGGTDEISAVLASNGARATGTVNVAPPEADVIQFVSAEPRIIAIKGTGSSDRSEKATVVFSVISGTGSGEDPGTPLPGVEVNFSLSTAVGGISLQNEKGTTDANGQVRTVVQSGTVATTVTVRAEIELDDGSTVFTTSEAIGISTGLPDQNSISLSTSTFIVEGAANMDGVVACLTVRMADRFNNPVVDGTQANFTTEYGAIDDFCTTGVRNGTLHQSQCEGSATPVPGSCSVAWISQNPRGPGSAYDEFVRTTVDYESSECDGHNGTSGPCPTSLGEIAGLRTTILVIADGEESFVDENGNGMYDRGEPFDNLPEAFIDHNEDGVYTKEVGPQCPPPTSAENCEAAGAEEEFKDYNSNSVYDLNVDPVTGRGIYNGSLCPREGEQAGWCSRELLHVRDDIVLVMGFSTDSDYFDIQLVNERTERVVTSVRQGDPFVAYIADVFNNPPAGGTEITVSADGDDCELITPTTFTAPDTSRPGAFGIPIRVDSANGTGGVGTITVNVGEGSFRTFSCVTEEDPELEQSPG
jgi:hypothetical protein